MELIERERRERHEAEIQALVADYENAYKRLRLKFMAQDLAISALGIFVVWLLWNS